jgi:voltage-gated potassium channel
VARADTVALGTTFAIVAGLVAVYYVLPLDERSWVFGLFMGLTALAGLVLLTLRWARKILESTRPLVRATQALVFLLTVLVLSFAAVYYALEHSVAGELPGLETKTDALYFTVTMLSTVGFGDIVPAGQTARAIATVQMLFDLAFVGVLIRLLTWAAGHRREAITTAETGSPAAARRL